MGIYIFFIVSSGDVEINPGPGPSTDETLSLEPEQSPCLQLQ